MPTGYPQPAAYLAWSTTAGGSNNSYLAFDVVTSEEIDEGTTITEHPVEVGPDVADHVRIALIKVTLKVRSTNEPIPMMATPVVPTSGTLWGSGTSEGVLMPVVVDITGPGAGAVVSSITIPTWVNNITARALLATAAGAIGGIAGGQTGGAIGALAGGLLGGLLFAPKEEDVTFSPSLPGSPVLSSYSATGTVWQWPAGTDYVEATHQVLVDLKNGATVITFEGTKQSVPNMVIDTLSFSRSADTGSGEEITIGLKEVLIVTTQIVTAPIPFLPAGGGTPTVSKGSTGAPPPPAESAGHIIGGAIANGISSLASGPSAPSP